MRFPWTPKPAPPPRILPGSWQAALALVVIGALTGLGQVLVQGAYETIREDGERRKQKRAAVARQQQQSYDRPQV